MGSFESIGFIQAMRENNSSADGLSKLALSLQLGILSTQGHRVGRSFNAYRNKFSNALLLL